MTIGDIIKDKNYDYISFRMIIKLPDNSHDEDIFIGCAKSENGKLIALDGDTYSENETVLEYEEWQNDEKNIKNGITIIVDRN